MILRLIRQFPKFALVAVVILGSTALFAFWWVSRPFKRGIAGPSAPVEDVAPKMARIEARPNSVLLVDNDLYDLDTGGVIFNGWLKEGIPLALFYDSQNGKIMARYERGFVRYSLDGKEEAAMVQKSPPGFSDDLKWAIYVKDRDLWRADIDWSLLRFQNDRRLTTIEQFNDQFAANLVFSTDKVLIIRNNAQLLRVDLESGDVKPTRMALLRIVKRRSPNGRYFWGEDHGSFFCYDVDTDETKILPVGRKVLGACQWLGDDRCAIIVEGRQVVMYDRLKHSFAEVTELPFGCSQIGESSAGERFAFCIGAGKGLLIDFEKKTATLVAGGAGIKWVSPNTFACSREVLDSSLRGTWFHTVGQGERRIALDPYLVERSGPMMMMSPAGMIVYATKHGLSKTNSDGTEVTEIIKLLRPPGRVIGLAEWILH